MNSQALRREMPSLAFRPLGMDQELSEFMNLGACSSSVPEHIRVSGKLGHVLPRHNLPCVDGTVTPVPLEVVPSHHGKHQHSLLLSPKKIPESQKLMAVVTALRNASHKGLRMKGLAETCGKLPTNSRTAACKCRLVNQSTLDIEDLHF